MKPWRVRWLGLAGLTVLMVGPLGAMTDLAQDHADQAARLERAGRLRDAGAELDAALQLAPARQDWQQRRDSLQGRVLAPVASAAVSPSATALQVQALLEQARLAYRGSDLVAADAAWRQALDLRPGTAEAAEGLERLKAESYRHDADQPFDQSVGDLYAAALREWRKGRWVEARQKLLDAKALNPVQPQVLQALGWAEQGAKAQQGSRDAQGWLQEARHQQLDGNDAKAAEAYSAALQAQPDLAEARQGMEQLRQRNADKVAAALAAGASAARRNDWTEAERAYSLALSLDPGRAEAASGQALARERLDQGKAAAQRRARCDKEYNQGVESWQAGDLATAAVRFRAALQAEPLDADAIRALASVEKKLGLQRDADRAEAAAQLKEGRRLEAAGALEEAARCYQRAAVKDPGLAEAGEAQAHLEKRMKGL